MVVVQLKSVKSRLDPYTYPESVSGPDPQENELFYKSRMTHISLFFTLLYSACYITGNWLCGRYFLVHIVSPHIDIRYKRTDNITVLYVQYTVILLYLQQKQSIFTYSYDLQLRKEPFLLNFRLFVYENLSRLVYHYFKFNAELKNVKLQYPCAKMQVKS